MKKRAVVLVIVLMVATVNFSFADKVDDSYINMFVGKFGSYTEEQKAERIDFVTGAMKNDTGLTVLYYKALEKESEFHKYNLTKETLKSNIDALKTWSVADRYALVDAAAKLDVEEVKKINDRNTSEESENEGSGSTGDGTAPVVGPVPGEDILEEELPIGSELNQILKEKGFLCEEATIHTDLEDKEFEDTKNHWSNEAVLFLAKRGMINGRTTTTFVPNANVTKAETIKLVMNLIVSDTTKIKKSDVSLGDVSEKNWFSEDVRKAITLGIITQSEDGMVDPARELTREEVIEVIVKSITAMELEISDELKVDNVVFTDFDTITEERQEAVIIATNLGIISGMGDGTVAPKDKVTRAQIATIMNNFYGYLIENINNK